MKPAQKQFVCDVCDKPVPIQKGIVQHRPMPREFKIQLAAWEKKNPGPFRTLQVYMDRPDEPPLWQLGHLDCFKDINEDYWFPLDNCANPNGVLHWTAHLSHKAWFDIRDWGKFIERHFLYGKPSKQDSKAADPKPK
jgi:hypothetical protein